ncbi:MAG: ABC transporter six-transmembrane domain-containing protein [Bacteroidales bacterium]|nr:ABC transporter six-transmembrane domain-containing protein [Bacteroidales bacterium]
MAINRIFKQNQGRLLLTLGLIFMEAILGILFPLFIGKAIDGLINNNLLALVHLALPGLLLILIGGSRRLFDSRFYAKIYTQLCTSTMHKTETLNTSVKAARLNMLAEMVSFAENQLPEIIQHSIGLIAVTFIIGFLNFEIFIGAIVCGLLVFIIYLLSSKKTHDYNSSFNNEMENQVNIIALNKQSEHKYHLLKLMKWNIRLSDIETVNYSISWFIMLLLLISSIYMAMQGDNIQYGVLLTLIMYVYQFIESVVSLPLYYQQWLRLREITQRIKIV